MKFSSVCILCFLLWFWSPTMSDSPLGNSTESQKEQVKTAEEAIAKANLYMGLEGETFDKLNPVVCYFIDTITNDKTPFLDSLINNHPVWKVEYKGIIVGKGKSTLARDFDVILDYSTGKILSVYSIAPGIGLHLNIEEPDADKSEKYWNNVVSMNLPDSLPNTDFLTALQEIVFNPAKVRILRGMYVDIITENSTTNHWWIIIARGSEVPFAGRGSGTSSGHSLMFGIDGMTGQRTSFTNAP